RYQHSLPGPASYPHLVLTRGLTDIDTLWNWYDHVTRGIIRRKNGTIMLLDRRHIPVMWWEFRNAYPVKWSGPQLKADSSEVAVEQVELVHEGLRKPMAGKLLAAARAGLRMGKCRRAQRPRADRGGRRRIGGPGAACGGAACNRASSTPRSPWTSARGSRPRRAPCRSSRTCRSATARRRCSPPMCR